jgi:hypothetical protein
MMGEVVFPVIRRKRFMRAIGETPLVIETSPTVRATNDHRTPPKERARISLLTRDATATDIRSPPHIPTSQNTATPAFPKSQA